jgi:hypothetical protein
MPNHRRTAKTVPNNLPPNNSITADDDFDSADDLDPADATISSHDQTFLTSKFVAVVDVDAWRHRWTPRERPKPRRS